MDESEIRTTLDYEFFLKTYSNHKQLGKEVFHFNNITQQTVSNRFVKFLTGKFGLTKEQRGRPGTNRDNDDLKVSVVSDSSQNVHELSLLFDVSKQTIVIHLPPIGKVKSLGKWVAHGHK